MPCNSPRHFPSASGERTTQIPKETKPQVADISKPKTWASLLNAQTPSKSMKLEHYPEFQKGKDAHVQFDESRLDDGVGKHCLVGQFLDGKMPFPLLSATAHVVLKDFGRFTVKQLGACFLFEFDDEESKLKELVGGAYFFSRRYLVLKEWKRILVRSKIQPSIVPVWG